MKSIGIYAFLVVSSLLEAIEPNKLKEYQQSSQANYTQKLKSSITDESLLEKINDIEITSRSLLKEGDIVYIFVSSSLNSKYLSSLISEWKKLYDFSGTRMVLLTRGIQNRELIELLNDSIKEVKSSSQQEISQIGLRMLVSPSYFKENNITKVPAFIYAHSKGDISPASNTPLYISRGEKGLGDFFKLISQKEEQYEIYVDAITAP